MARALSCWCPHSATCAGSRRARRDLIRWLLLIPLILLLLFGCGSMAMLGNRPAFADTRSVLSADYRPWPFTVFGSVDPRLIEETPLAHHPPPPVPFPPSAPPSPTVSPTASASPSPTATFTATASATPSGPPVPIPPVLPPSNTYWFYDDAAPVAYMMYTTSPSGVYRSGDSVSFHSPAFALGQTIAGGVTTANFYAYNPSSLAAVFTIQLRAGGTLLGSGTFALPANTFDANFYSASFASSTHDFTAGERLQVSFSLPSPAQLF